MTPQTLIFLNSEKFTKIAQGCKAGNGAKIPSRRNMPYACVDGESVSVQLSGSLSAAISDGKATFPDALRQLSTLNEARNYQNTAPVWILHTAPGSKAHSAP